MAFKRNKQKNEPRGETPQGKIIDAEGLEIQKFKLKSHNPEQAQQDESFKEVLKAAKDNKKKKRRTRKAILTEEAKERAVKGRIHEIASFLAVGAPIATFLYLQHLNPDPSIQAYLELRVWIIPAAWLIIVYEGWKNTNLSGVLCALLPPYWIYFLVAEVDNRIMRGSVSAIVVILALETFYIPDEAWLNGRQKQFDAAVIKFTL